MEWSHTEQQEYVDLLNRGIERLQTQLDMTDAELRGACERIEELEEQLAHTQELLRCVERDISGEPYIEHHENTSDWFRAKGKAIGEKSE